MDSCSCLGQRRSKANNIDSPSPKPLFHTRAFGSSPKFLPATVADSKKCPSANGESDHQVKAYIISIALNISIPPMVKRKLQTWLTPSSSPAAAGTNTALVEVCITRCVSTFEQLLQSNLLLRREPACDGFLVTVNKTAATRDVS